MRIARQGLSISGDGVLSLVTVDGQVGTAPCSEQTPECAERLANESLAGEDARAIGHLYEALHRVKRQHEWFPSALIAAIDIALWDLNARSREEPLWRALGALRSRVRVHVRAAPGVAPPALRQWCEAHLRPLGIQDVITPCSGNIGVDANRLVTLREALSSPGKEAALMLDAREQWDVKEAVRHVRFLERSADLTWIEQPLSGIDADGHRRLSASIRGAVCGGGRETSPQAYQTLLKARALDIVQLDVRRLGLTGVLRVADAAYGYELPVALLPCPGSVQLHAAAALPNCASAEIDLADSGSLVEAGYAVPPDVPGHGSTSFLRTART